MGKEAHFPSLRPLVSPRSSSIYLVSGVVGPGAGAEGALFTPSQQEQCRGDGCAGSWTLMG